MDDILKELQEAMKAGRITGRDSTQPDPNEKLTPVDWLGDLFTIEEDENGEPVLMMFQTKEELNKMIELWKRFVKKKK